MIDDFCFQVIEKTNENNYDIEALKFEIVAYKLKVKEKYYTPLNYEDNRVKPNNYNKDLTKKYDQTIKGLVSSKINLFIKNI